jgi:hypothetical protein
MKVNGKDYSHILWKIKNVPNHQPGEQIVPWIRITAGFSVINLYIDRTFTYPTKIGQVLELYGVKHHVYGKKEGQPVYTWLTPPSLLRKAAGSAFPLDTSTRSDRPLWRLAPAPCPDQSLVKQNAANTSDVCCFHDDFTIIYRDYTCYNRETYGDTLGLCLPI